MNLKKNRINPLVVVFSISFALSVGLLVFAVSKGLTGFSTSSLESSEHQLLSFDGLGNIGVLNLEGVISESIPTLEVLKEFEENKRIKAVIIRVDSPGGAVGPSQEIFDQIKKLRQKGKIVVASLGSVAASGGYYVACAADKIVSAAGTLTGSIGVIMHLSNLEEFYNWIKIKPYTIKSGKFKDLGATNRAMTPEERSYLQSLIDSTHMQFQKAVAEGRGLPLEFVKTFADGRIMNGEMAHSFQLVDQLGNFQDAVDLAAKEAGIKKPKLVYPKDKKIFDWREMFGAMIKTGVKSLQEIKVIPQNFNSSGLNYLWDRP